MKFPIKIVFITEDQEYIAFVDGIKGLQGCGQTEEEAIEDLKNLISKEMT